MYCLLHGSITSSGKRSQIPHSIGTHSIGTQNFGIFEGTLRSLRSSGYGKLFFLSSSPSFARASLVMLLHQSSVICALTSSISAFNSTDGKQEGGTSNDPTSRCHDSVYELCPKQELSRNTRSQFCRCANNLSSLT